MRFNMMPEGIGPVRGQSNFYQLVAGVCGSLLSSIDDKKPRNRFSIRIKLF